MSFPGGFIREKEEKRKKDKFLVSKFKKHFLAIREKQLIGNKWRIPWTEEPGRL